MQLKVKLIHDKAILPHYAHPGDAGLDLFSVERKVIPPGESGLIHTGIVIQLPPNSEAQVRPRSGLALKHGIGLVNSPGTIDSDYRGEIKIILFNFGKTPFVINRGDRVAQMVINRVERVTLIERENLETTERGSGGFGHTGLSS